MKQSQKLHFVGIGGSGMSGIAEVLLNLGHEVSGSDLKTSDITKHLTKQGARIHLGHRADQVSDDTDVVVVSNAILATNPELRMAQEKKIPIVPRAQILNDLMRLKKGIAIAGTHGKTTTASMLAWILGQAKLDPTLVIGGILNNIGRGAKMGKGEYFVVEACEAYSSFLHLFPIALAVTNIDNDHIENYGSRAALDEAFVNFINRVPFWGLTVLNYDDPGICNILPRIMRRVITYGLSDKVALRATTVVETKTNQSFMVYYKTKRLGRIEIQLPGRFNLLNALAALGLAIELGVNFRLIKQALASFSGVRRRFEYKGEFKQTTVIDDYAHHPTEVAATLQAARNLKPSRVIVLFQPHLFSRTQRLYKEFSRALLLADKVFLADIYPARERPIPGVSSQLIADQLKLEGQPVALGPRSLAKILPKIRSELKAGDIFITMGAGDVNKLGEELLKYKPKRSKKNNEK